MAGKRKRNTTARARQGTAARGLATMQRSTQHFEERARTTDPLQRLWVAVSYLRAAIKRAAPELGSTAADEVSGRAFALARELDKATTVALREQLRREES